MLILVSGGSGSGKSKFAEDLAVRGPAPHIYVATMRVWGAEGEARVARHQAMRAGKGFSTLETPTNLEQITVPFGATVLLEDLGNLMANEWFCELGHQEALTRALNGALHLATQAVCTIIVTNELSSDGISYDENTAAYLSALSTLNQALATRADEVYESICGIPICHKGVKK